MGVEGHQLYVGAFAGWSNIGEIREDPSLVCKTSLLGSGARSVQNWISILFFSLNSIYSGSACTVVYSGRETEKLCGEMAGIALYDTNTSAKDPCNPTEAFPALSRPLGTWILEIIWQLQL